MGQSGGAKIGVDQGDDGSGQTCNERHDEDPAIVAEAARRFCIGLDEH